MQENAATFQEIGIIAKEAYSDYQPGYVIEGDNLTSTYTVIATQDSLIGNLFPNLFGFQAMLLKDSGDNYVIGFRGTEGKTGSNLYF